jgi:glycerol-3-phosphate dehydrogenase
MTVEGVPTAKVAVEFAQRCGLDLPIFTTVHQIITAQIKIEVSF